MGKRRHNPRQILGAAAGFAKVHYCVDHNKLVKAYRLWPKKNMRFRCDDGCDLSKQETVLKVKEASKSRKWDR